MHLGPPKISGVEFHEGNRSRVFSIVLQRYIRRGPDMKCTLDTLEFQESLNSRSRLIGDV